MAGGVPAGRLSIEIVAEIQRLQADLDKAKRMVNAASKDFDKSAKAANDNISRMGSRSKLANHHLANLSFQIQDIAVGLQGGQKPMTVFLQQGGQIGQIMGQAGIGVGGLVKAVGSMTANFVKAHPILVAFTATAGAATIAFKDFTNQVGADRNADLQAYAKSLGLTAEQIEEVGGAAVTSGDMLLGLWDMFKEFTGVEDIFADVKGWIVDNIRAAVLDAKKALSEFYAAAAATVDTIKHVWKNLGPILADGVISGVNAAIGAVERLVNDAIRGIDLLTRAINPLLILTDKAGITSTLGPVSFGRLNNQFAGSGAAAADSWASAYQKRLGEAHNSFDKFMGDWADAGTNRAKQRLGKAAEEAAKESGKKAGKKAGKDTAESWLEELEKDLAKGFAQIFRDRERLIKDIMKTSDDEFDEILETLSIKGDAAIQEGIIEPLEAAYERAEALVNVLSRMPGIGGVLGQLGFALGSGNPIASLIGMGGVGTIAGTLLGGRETTEKLSLAMYDGLKRAGMQSDELAGKLGGVLANVFQGAAIGGAVTSIVGGSSAGGTIGGALGQAVGGKALGFLGGAAGPVGAVVGSILGSVVGGLFGSTKRGGQTISNGALAGTWGNSSSRTGAATGIAGNALDALGQLADALDVTLGAFSSSISIRKDNLRFDPTGSGISKTSKGAIDFGQDEEALLKAVIKDAISDGAFEGLSQGFKDYLTSGDVEQRLQDVLNIRAIQDEAARLRDPQGFDLAQLDKWREQAAAVFTATGQDLADLEYVYGKRREEILEAANDNIVDLTRERTALMIQIAELEGRSTEALAMARELEKSEADESLRPLYDRIYALQDEAVALEAANAAQREREALQAAIDSERYGLETRLLQLQGDTVALRQRELDALNEHNRPFLRMIFALEDEAAAAEAAAAATAALAAEAEALAAKQAAIAAERYGLETQLLTLQGKTEELRARELALLDPSNRELQKQIWALEDAQAAAQAAAAAQSAYTDQINAARDALSQAYGRERSELEQTRDKFAGFAQTIRDFRLSLIAANDNTLAGSRSRLNAAFRSGDPSAFTGAAGAYLETAMAGAGSRLEYQRSVSLVAGQARELERQFGNQAASAERQIQLLEQQVSQWIDLNENVLTVEEAIKNLEDLGAEKLPQIADNINAGMVNVSNRVDAMADRLEQSEALTRAALESIAINTARAFQIWNRIEDSGSINIKTQEGDTVATAA